MEVRFTMTMKETPMDHTRCVPAETGNARAHNHEGEKGRWLFPGDLKADGTPKGLYDDSPTGAGF